MTSPIRIWPGDDSGTEVRKTGFVVGRACEIEGPDVSVLTAAGLPVEDASLPRRSLSIEPIGDGGWQVRNITKPDYDLTVTVVINDDGSAELSSAHELISGSARVCGRWTTVRIQTMPSYVVRLEVVDGYSDDSPSQASPTTQRPSGHSTDPSPGRAIRRFGDLIAVLSLRATWRDAILGKGSSNRDRRQQAALMLASVSHPVHESSVNSALNSATSRSLYLTPDWSGVLNGAALYSVVCVNVLGSTGSFDWGRASDLLERVGQTYSDRVLSNAMSGLSRRLDEVFSEDFLFQLALLDRGTSWRGEMDTRSLATFLSDVILLHHASLFEQLRLAARS